MSFNKDFTIITSPTSVSLAVFNAMVKTLADAIVYHSNGGVSIISDNNPNDTVARIIVLSTLAGHNIKIYDTASGVYWGVLGVDGVTLSISIKVINGLVSNEFYFATYRSNNCYAIVVDPTTFTEAPTTIPYAPGASIFVFKVQNKWYIGFASSTTGALRFYSRDCDNYSSPAPTFSLDQFYVGSWDAVPITNLCFILGTNQAIIVDNMFVVPSGDASPGVLYTIVEDSDGIEYLSLSGASGSMVLINDQ